MFSVYIVGMVVRKKREGEKLPRFEGTVSGDCKNDFVNK